MSRSDLPPPDQFPSPVSPAQIASLLDVGISTVKRWVDSGLIPARVTPGGHRKLLLEDVLRLSKAGSLPGIARAEKSPRTTDDLRAELGSAFRNNDVESIGGVIREALPIGLLADAVIAPAMRRLGSDWAVGRATVAREHRATQAVVSAVYELNERIGTTEGKDRPVAVGCAPEHDHYILPTLLAGMTLVEAGWNAVNVGPNTPFSALLTAADELKPRLVWLSVSHLADPERFVAEYRDFYRIAEARGIAVALGGQALDPGLRSRLVCTTFGDGLVHLAAFAELLHPRKRTPKRGRPAGSGKKPG